ETIFILFLLLFIMAMHRYLQTNSGKALLAAAIITSFACVTRYVGITIIVTGGILILLNTKLSLRKRFADEIIFSVISSLLLAINLYRNYHLSGMLTGNREKSITSLMQNM